MTCVNDRTLLPADAVCIARADLGKEKRLHNTKWILHPGGAAFDSYPYVVRDKSLRDPHLNGKDWYSTLVSQGRKDS